MDYHADMDGEVFEKWFKMRLSPNLPEKCMIILDNASYHRRQVEKIPTISTLKRDMVTFILESTPIKAGLPERIKIANITKHYIIDKMALEKGHRVLCLSPYHCCLNAIEMVWHQIAEIQRQTSECLFR